MPVPRLQTLDRDAAPDHERVEALEQRRTPADALV
jgi:hypothetical protein